jgi:hypothetical protein
MTQRSLRGDIEELQQARELRLAADRRASMSERLARVHALCKQMSALKGAARPR